MRLPIYQVDAFAERVFQGNPAAVCPLDAWLPDATMQTIAAENNLSETAFVVPTDDGHAIRWFTPTVEVDLCGHATLAAAHVLFATGMATTDTLRLSSRGGELRVQRDGDRLTLDFPAETAEPCETPATLAKALGVTPIACFRATDYMAVLADDETVAGLAPDMRLLAELDRRGVIVTAPGRQTDFVSRFFAPRYGIDEDPVTGSAHCLLAPYWADRLGRDDLSARQLSARSGRLDCRVAGDRVLITGQAVMYLRGEIELPDPAVESRRSTGATGEIAIRSATRADAAYLVDFNRRLAAETEDKTLDPTVLAAGVAEVLRNPARGRYWLAEIDGVVVGCLMVTTEWSDWRNGEFWWIQSVYVLPDYRRRGVFSALYRWVRDQATADPGVCGCRLYVERENEQAQATYHRLGFSETHYKLLESLI